MSDPSTELMRHVQTLLIICACMAVIYGLARGLLTDVPGGKTLVKGIEKWVGKLFQWLARQIYRLTRRLILAIGRGIARLYRWLRTP